MRDAAAFKALCQQEHPSDGGIGTLREKTLHRVLKNWIEPRADCREQPFAGFVVDILNEEGVTEIQTRGFFSLRHKLEQLLEQTPVRVVFPLTARRWIRWADPETGALSPQRLSPKRGIFLDAFYELVHIAPLLGHPNLTLELLLIDAEELRLRCGRGADGKRGAVRIELLPLALADQCVLHTPCDYAALLGQELPDPFTCALLRSLTKRSETLCRRTLYTLERLGAIQRAGKQGRSLLYTRISPCAKSLEYDSIASKDSAGALQVPAVREGSD